MNILWDEAKNTVNISKHGIDFADAAPVFTSPMLVAVDNREDYGETRYVGIGMLYGRVVVIVYTEPEDTPDTIRVISLRRAAKHEQTRYERELKNQLGAG